MEKVWFQNYPEGSPTTLDTLKYDSILDILDKAIREHPDRPAYINMGQVLTFRKLEERSRAFAAYLQNELKLKRGDRVALMMPNLLQYPIALFGILRAGLVVVNVNPLYTPRELEHQLQDSGATAIVVVSNFASTLEKIVFNTKVKHVILTRMGDQLSFGKRNLVNFVVKYVKKLVPKYKLPNAVTFREVLSIGKYRQYVRPQVEREDLAFLQYTGGTTGVAKGAMLTHGNIITNIFQAKWIAEPFIGDHAKQRIAVLALPLYHVFALTVNCLLFLELGVTALLITNPRDIDGFVKELKKYRFEAITGVNTLFNALLNNENFKEVDFSRLKLWVKGEQVMRGYWQRPEATAEVLQDGWMATGDIVIMDESYSLRIVDRKKDMILVSGFNVYPNEIEDVVMLNYKVVEVVAIGVPHEVSGETIKIFVVKKDDSLTRDELRQHCRQHLTGYKIPKDIEFRDELPKSNVGKILRRVLRDEEIAKRSQH